MYMLLYMKPMWCNSIPEIYAGLGGSSAMGRCALCYIWNVFSVMVFQRSMLHWRRGWGQSPIGICALCYIWNFFDVMVFQRSMLDCRRGWSQYCIGICALCYIWNLCGEVGSICHSYMCIVLYISASLV